MVVKDLARVFIMVAAVVELELLVKTLQVLQLQVMVA
jgi:hypothetical protein